jgi:hypothetical protein
LTMESAASSVVLVRSLRTVKGFNQVQRGEVRSASRTPKCATLCRFCDASPFLRALRPSTLSKPRKYLVQRQGPLDPKSIGPRNEPPPGFRLEPGDWRRSREGEENRAPCCPLASPRGAHRELRAAETARPCRRASVGAQAKACLAHRALLLLVHLLGKKSILSVDQDPNCARAR